MLLFVSSIVVGLFAAALLHELGHFAAGAALRCGPRLLCIGLGPALLRRRVGAVWVVLRPVPLGGYVLLPPRSQRRRLASLLVTAAGPAANLFALVLLGGARGALPGEVWFVASLAQSLVLCGSLLPSVHRIGAMRMPSDGSKMLTLLVRPRSYGCEALYAGVAARMLPQGDAPAMTAAFPEIVLQMGRPDRREPWGRRQAIEGLGAVATSAAANPMERALAHFLLDEAIRGDGLASRGRRVGPAAAGAEAVVTHSARAGLTGWLWIAVLVVAVIGPIYDARRRSTGEGGRLDAAQLHFELFRDRIDGHRAVALDGTIGGGAIVELRDAIARYDLGPRDVLLLDSPGGDLGNAAVMGRMIRRHGLATRVGALREGRLEPADCASACVALFAAGTSRVLPEGSRIGIHSFRSLDDGGRTVAEVERSARATERREVAYFAEMGVAPELEESAARVSSDDIRWLTPEEAMGLKLATSRGGAG